MYVTYNNITFKILKTNDHSMEAIYSDDGVDYLMTRVHIDVEGVLNPKAMAYQTFEGTPFPFQGILPGATVPAIRKTLLEPRGELQITDNIAQVVLLSPQPGFETDARNGPMPISCQVKQIFGARSWTIRWVCDVYIIECPLGDPTAIISNRWSDELHINQYHLSTRITSGKMVFRSDVLLLTTQVAHDMFDGTSIPAVVPGFRRTNLDVVVESSGLALLWRTTDVEMVVDLGDTDAREGGSGILHIEGSYGVTSIAAGDGPPGSMSMAQINIKAYGNIYSNQWTMVQRCLEIALTKISVGNNTVGFLRHVAIRESMGDDSKWVEVVLAFQQNATKTGPENFGNIRIDGLRKDISEVFEDQEGIQPGLPNSGGTRGSAIITLMTQALQDACAEATPPEPLHATGSGGMAPPEGPPPAITVTPVDEIPDRESLYNGDPQQEPYPYTRYKGSLEYETYGGTIQTPTSGPPPPQPSSGGSGGTGTMAPPTGGSPTGPPGFGATGTPGIGFSPSASTSTRQSGPGSVAWNWPSSIFQVSSPMAKVRVEFQAERVGLPPAVPTLTPNGDNLVYSMARLRPDMPLVWIDGDSIIYSVSGYYEFLMKVAPQPGDSLAMGVLPWTALTWEETQLLPNDFVSGIYDNPNATTGGTGSVGTST